MSDKLSTAVEATLSECFAAQGDMLDGFVGLANYIDEDGARCWTVFAPDQFVDRSFSMASHLHSFFETMRDMSIMDYMSERFDD